MKNIDAIIEKLLGFVFRILHIRLKEETFRFLVQFVKFGIVGVSNTLISYGVNVLVLTLLRPLNLSWDYMAANVAAFVAGTLWSFYWNNRYVFTTEEGQKRSKGRALLKTFLAYGFTGIILTNVLSYIWVDVLGISKYVAPLINLVISVPVNFLINKFWAFRAEN